MRNPDTPTIAGTNAIRPKYAPLAVFLRIYGESRTGAYRLLAEGKLRAVKAGRSLRIDCEHADAYYASLPTATFASQREAA